MQAGPVFTWTSRKAGMGILRTIFMISVSVGLSACNQQVKDFVKTTAKVPAVPPPKAVLPLQTTAHAPIKMGPGHFEGSDVNGAIQAHVTPTNQVLTSTDTSAKITFGQVRVDM